MKLWMGEPYRGQPRSTLSCPSPLSCATMWSWQVSAYTVVMNILIIEDAEVVRNAYKFTLCRLEKVSTRLLLFLYIDFAMSSLFPPAPCCRLWESPSRADGGSPLVVSSSPAGRAAVWGNKPHRGQRGETGGDWTQVPHSRSLINQLYISTGFVLQWALCSSLNWVHV